MIFLSKNNRSVIIDNGKGTKYKISYIWSMNSVAVKRIGKSGKLYQVDANKPAIKRLLRHNNVYW